MNVISLLLASVLFTGIAPAQKGAQRPSSAHPLSEQQKRGLQAIEADMKAKAAPLAVKIAALAQSLDRNTLADQPDADLDRRLTSELSQTVNEGLQLRLAAVRETVKILTPEQKSILRAEMEKPDANPDLIDLVTKLFGK
jgi:hypothetical protein